MMTLANEQIVHQPVAKFACSSSKFWWTASNALKRDYRYIRLKVSKGTYTRMMPFDPAST